MSYIRRNEARAAGIQKTNSQRTVYWKTQRPSQNSLSQDFRVYSIDPQSYTVMFDFTATV